LRSLFRVLGSEKILQVVEDEIFIFLNGSFLNALGIAPVSLLVGPSVIGVAVVPDTVAVDLEWVFLIDEGWLVWLLLDEFLRVAPFSLLIRPLILALAVVPVVLFTENKFFTIGEVNFRLVIRFL